MEILNDYLNDLNYRGPFSQNNLASKAYFLIIDYYGNNTLESKKAFNELKDLCNMYK